MRFYSVGSAAKIAFRFLAASQMPTLYFLGITLGGGLLALFLSAGWSSFKHKKIPEKGILFRWFVAGIVAAGLIAYAWIFGSGGDVGEVINRIGETLDIQNVMKLAATVGTVAVATEALEDSAEAKEAKEAKEELKIGMPNF
jgi:hypothetical protein